jgi:RNA polymerase sigma-70 factor (ECF subfamily)
MVAVRMDKRLAARVDASDIVQEALTEASQKLPDYLQQERLPFYPWLRQLAWESLIGAYRRHVGAKARSVTREQHDEMVLPDHSSAQLAARLLASGTSPSARISRKELRVRVQRMLSQLSPRDREVLVLRYLEQLSTSETAAVLGLTVDGVKSRQRRALERFSNLLADHSWGDS